VGSMPDPVMLEVGPLRTYYYGVAYAIGLVIVSLWIFLRREVLGYHKGEVAEFSLAFAVGVLAGGRLFDVFLYEWSFFREHPLAVFALWRGGMATHGVMLGAILAGAAFCFYRGKSFLALADEVVIPGAVLMGLGRIGNHINGEVFGSVTNLPWATGFPYAEDCRHPVALYDGLKNLLLVPILLGVRFAYRRAGYEPPPGVLFGHFVFWYGFLRLFVDVFREYDSYWLGVGRGQYFNLAMALAGLSLVLLAHLLGRRRRAQLAPSFRAIDSGRQRDGALGAKMALFAVLVVSCLFIPSGWTQQALEGFEQRTTEGSGAGRCPMVAGLE
jgi:phosphatidylglycerol---prolipoprotein diacylglyceryl transferase